MDNSQAILLTPKETKAFLKASIPTINKLVEHGTFKKYKFPNSKRIYYKKQEIIDALEVLDPNEKARDKILKAMLKSMKKD